MNPLVLAPVLELGSKLIDRWFPNPEDKAKAELELFKTAQEGDLKALLGQLEINAKEAAHPSVFVAGWRPFVGWGSGFGFLYATIIHNVMSWVATIKGWPAPPAVDVETLLYVLLGMLGLGGLRTYEKVKGATK